MYMKTSPIKTLNKLVFHQKISEEKVRKKYIQNNRVEDLEEVDNPQIDDHVFKKAKLSP